MARLSAAALVLAASFVSSVTSTSVSTNWTRVFVDQSQGAACLDGTPPVYYIKEGVGENATKFILFFEGGGWCVSLEDCYGRSKTPLGSSSTYRPTTDAWAVRDLLNPDASLNTAFSTWTTVYEPYCDGTSRAGNVAGTIPVNGKPLYFRGFNNLKSTVQALLDLPSGGLRTATHLLITGSSAGGLTTYLHADYVADTVHAVNPSAVVKAVPEVGFFLDANSIWGGERITTELYTRLAAFSNVTGGNPIQVNSACVAATPAEDRWKCFMAQYSYSYTHTPIFMLQSRVDQWQTQNILAVDPSSLGVNATITTYPPFAACLKDPSTGCNATQFAQWSNYSHQFFVALNASIAGASPASQAANGGFVTSCNIHTTAIGGLSFTITIDGVHMYDALVDWFFEQSPRHWWYDVEWPGDKTCPGNGEAVLQDPVAWM